jgi:hypothetical protein
VVFDPICELRCAQEFDDTPNDYTNEYVANHPDAARG